jgi:hypothetical protein
LGKNHEAYELERLPSFYREMTITVKQIKERSSARYYGGGVIPENLFLHFVSVIFPGMNLENNKKYLADNLLFS